MLVTRDAIAPAADMPAPHYGVTMLTNMCYRWHMLHIVMIIQVWR